MEVKEDVMRGKRFLDATLENSDVCRMGGENTDINREAKGKPG